MRIISKQSLGFRNQETNQIVYVRPLEISTVPDWVANDLMYIWAKTEGIIEDVEKPIQAAMVNTTVEDDSPETKPSRRHSRKKE